MLNIFPNRAIGFVRDAIPVLTFPLSFFPTHNGAKARDYSFSPLNRQLNLPQAGKADGNRYRKSFVYT